MDPEKAKSIKVSPLPSPKPKSEELNDEDSVTIDYDDIVHDDLVGDLLIRLFNSPLIDDPLWSNVAGSKGVEAPAFMTFEISVEEIETLCALASASFLQQSALLEIDSDELPLHIIADIHGNLPQILRVFRTIGIPQKDTFLFLGDYVDRGVQGVEVITLLFCLKIRYPYQVYLLRGNHEDANTTLNYGFFDECISRWPEDGCKLGVKVSIQEDLMLINQQI
ncbi:hypothetical protein Q1695_004745 [Nippostrongylus brasiliensis]|nr:hypothetical protein Q1695_004745 [Nippostrongylus brasiliensis]